MNINGEELEYFDDGHIYLVNGVQVPSITEMMKVRFGHKFDGVPKDVLQKASEMGTRLHKAVERYVEHGEESDLVEMRNFMFLQKHYRFMCISSEVPVILHRDDEPIAAGRLDLVIEIDGKYGLADVKRTSVLDKDYLFYQLNLYRIAYEQCYTKKIEFLKGIHLRENTRRFVNIPINEDFAWKIVDQYEEEKR